MGLEGLPPTGRREGEEAGEEGAPSLVPAGGKLLD